MSLDAIATKYKEETEAASQLRVDDNVQMSLDVNAEKRLKAEHLAKVVGEQDVDFVERNYELVDRTARAKGLYEKLPANSVTRNILSDPAERASLPDAENLAKVEAGVTSLASVPAAAFRKGQDTYESGKMLSDLSLSGADDATLDELMLPYDKRSAAVSYDNLGFTGKLAGYSAESAGLYTAMAPDIAAGTLAATMGGFAGGNLPGAALGFAGGSHIMSAKEMFQVEQGHAFNEFRKLKFDPTGLPIDRTAALGASLLVGGANAGLEMIGFNSSVVKTLGVQQLVKALGKERVRDLLANPAARDAFAKIAADYAGGVITESATEGLQELTVIMMGDLLRGKFTDAGAYLSRTFESMVGGAFGGGGLGLPGTAVRSTKVALDQRQQTQRENALTALGEDVKTSKLYSNAPKKFQEFIRNVQDRHGLVDTVYMDGEAAQTFFQEVGDETLARDMPETAKSLRESIDTGGYVAIPLDEFVAHVAPSMEQVMEDITFDPDTPTQRQYEKVKAQTQELQDWYEKTQGEIDSEEDYVYGSAYTQLRGAGRSDQVAQKEAMLFTLGIRAAAKREGMEPEEYYRSKKINIRGDITAQGGDDIDIPTMTGGLLNLLREGRGPAQKDVFGESLVEFLMGMGIKDEGGELSARDLEKQMQKYGRRRLARDTGVDMTEAFERARDAGYLDLGDHASEANALLAAIDRELQGERVYSPSQLSPGAQSLDVALEELRQLLDQQQIDVNTMSNEDILERLGVAGTEFIQSAYHGTPSLFDKFSLAFMGSGEGAQAYGWGLYFAGNRKVAEDYRDKLTPRDFDYEKELMRRYKAAERAQDYEAMEIYENAMMNETPDEIRKRYAGPDYSDEFREKVETIASELDAMGVNHGNLYQVDIPEDHEVLDYDKTLRQQPEAVQKILLDSGLVTLEENGNDTGAQIYSIIAQSFAEDARKKDAEMQSTAGGWGGFVQTRDDKIVNEKAASEYLKSLGIPGLRYIDQFSRNRPVNEIIAEFREELPDDAEFDDVTELFDTGHFSPQNERVLKALEADDWLGFDYPAQAISAAYKELEQYDPSPELRDAVEAAKEGGTHNYVIWDEDRIHIEGVNDKAIHDAFRQEEQAQDETTTYYQSATLRSGKETLAKYGLNPKGKYKTREVAAALEARQRAKYGKIESDDRTGKSLGKIAKWMAEEVMFEMVNPEKSGVGWYSEKFQRALDTMADRFPELKTDKAARSTMTALIAITSDGQKVLPNFAMAMDIYKNFKESGKFRTSIGHQRQESIDQNMDMMQHLFDTMGPVRMHEYLMQENTISNLKKLAKENGGELKSDYQAHITMPMAAVVFGPKLGAFYANLMGAHGYLTMDRWWSRTFNRYRGTLLQAPNAGALRNFAELIGKPELSDDEVVAAVVGPRNAYGDRDFKTRIAELVGRPEPTKKGEKVAWHEEARKLAGDQYDELMQEHKVERSANTIYKAAFENLEDAPFNATDRTFMLKAVNKARDVLAKKGYNLTIADIQAILWYYEKRLYGELGAKGTADISYEEAARQITSGEYEAKRQSLRDKRKRNAKNVADAGAAVPVGEETFEEGQEQTLEQAGDKKKSPRGKLDITKDRQLIITLTKAANLSTFIHESGHLFLELLGDSAQAEGANQQSLDDYATVMEWFGIDNRADITREHHEMFARGFEAYLFEGKAPTKELAGLFSHFKSWLMGVYRTIKRLDVDLTPEIRAVFDRLLVGDAAIEHVTDDIVPAFKGNTSGLTETEINTLMALQRQAIRAGYDEMEAQAMAEIKAVRSQHYQDRKRTLTKEVAERVNAQPVYAVQNLLRTGNDENMVVPEELLGAKMSSQAIINMFADTKILRRVVGLANKEGLHPDVFADLYGFESGYKMVQEIVAAPPRKEVITNQVQAQLDEEFGNMAQDTELPERAALALHNNAMATFILAEVRSINRRLGRKPDTTTLNQATKEAARRHVAGLKLRQVRPHAYYQAELKAARAAQEAIAAGKYEEAAQLKQQQLLNHHLYREARNAQDRASVLRDRLKKYDSVEFMRKIRKGDPMAANGIDALLSAVEFKKVPMSQVDARTRLAAYVQAMEAQGEVVLIDPALYAGADLINYKEMTLEQLEALDTSVAALAKQGRDAHKIMVDGEAVEMNQAIEDLRAVASVNMTAKATNQYDVDHRSELTKVFSGLLASLRKIEFECRFADGDITGKWHRTIFQPFVDAQNAKAEMLGNSVDELKRIMSTISRKDAVRLDEMINFLGTKLKRGDLYVAVLNMGNQGNWDRLFSTRWKGQERAVLRQLQDELTVDDFRRIEALGQFIDRFYDPMAAVSQKVDGILPPKVEAKELYLDKYGITLSGWYYPVKYEDKIGTREQSVLEETNSIDLGTSPVTGQVSKSMTKSRVKNATGVISLDLAGLPQHLHQVAHYITHYEAVRNLDKLRRKTEFREMYQSFFGEEGYFQLRSWLQNIATNGTIADTSHRATKFFNTTFRRARFGGSMVALGWKVSSALMQVLGVGPAAKELGGLRMASWMLKLSYGRAGTAWQARVHPDYQRALDASPELRYLDGQIDRDVREFTDRAVNLLKKAPVKAQIHWLESNAFCMIIAVQKHINAATWLAAHEQAQERGMTVQESVQYADATVRQTQSGGGLKDLAGIQQGSEIVKLVSLFYTYFSVQHNQLRLTGRQDLLKGFVQGDGPHGRVKSLQKFVAANLWIVLAPAFVEGFLKYDEDDDGDEVAYFANRIVSSYLSGLPIIRDIYSKATKGFTMPSTPLDQVLGSLTDVVKGLDDIPDGKWNWTDFRNLMKAASLITYIPFYQVTAYYEALATSDDFGEAISHVFFGTPYSERKKLAD